MDTETQEKRFPNITVKMLFLSTFVGLLVERPIIYIKPVLIHQYMSWVDEQKLLVTLYAVSLLQSVMYMVGGWLADSYVGKYGIYTTSVFMHTLATYPLLGSATIDYTFSSASSQRHALLVGTCMYILTKLGYACLMPLLSEQFNMPQDRDNLTRYYLYDYWLKNFLLLCTEIVMPEILSTNFCKQSSCYAFQFFIGIGCNLFYVITILRFRKLFKRVSIKSHSVERSIRVIYEAIKAHLIVSMQKVLHPKRRHTTDTWFDLIEKHENRETVANTKTALNIFKVVTPCIAYYAGSQYVIRVWKALAYQTDVDFVMFSILPNYLGCVKYILVLILMPLSYKLLLPLSRKMKINCSKMKCIGAAYCLLALCLAHSTYVQINSTLKDWNPLKVNQVFFTIYNNLHKECEFFIKINENQNENDARYLSVAAMEMKSLRQELPANTSRVQVVVMQAGQQSTAVAQDLSGMQAASLMIFEDNRGRLVLVQDQLDISAMSFNPSLLFYCGIWPQCTNATIEIYNSRSSWTKTVYMPRPGKKVTIQLPNVGNYLVSIGGVEVPTDRFGTRGLYSFIVYNKSNETIINNYKVIKPNNLHIAWLIPQFIGAAFADILAYVNIEIFIYAQSPVPLRAFIFTYGEFIRIAGEGMLVSLIAVPEPKLFYQYYVSIGIMAFLVLYTFFVAKYKFITIHEEDFY